MCKMQHEYDLGTRQEMGRKKRDGKPTDQEVRSSKVSASAPSPRSVKIEPKAERGWSTELHGYWGHNQLHVRPPKLLPVALQVNLPLALCGPFTARSESVRL